MILEIGGVETKKSVFLLAGAGSGKTRALVSCLNQLRESEREVYSGRGQQVAVITYTRAASQEILTRVDFDNMFWVSTIHSFAWEQIKSFHVDIREWMRESLTEKIDRLNEEQKKGRAGTAAATKRERQIIRSREKLDELDRISSFTYSPEGMNSAKHSLNHAEVIAIFSNFLCHKPLMANLLVQRYPILFIDECQDTQKDLMEAFLSIEEKYGDRFRLLMFGDMMQRIYLDGMDSLGDEINENWAKPEININYRCPKRIVTLLNKIRSEVDDHTQLPMCSSPEGIARVFIIQNDKEVDKNTIEASIASEMMEITGDSDWVDFQNVKRLTLEHAMAARRGGFIDFFEPLYKINNYKTGFLDGSLVGVSFIRHQVLPLLEAIIEGDNFRVAQQIKSYSPLFSEKRAPLKKITVDTIKEAALKIEKLSLLLKGHDNNPKLIQVLKVVLDENIFLVPEVFLAVLEEGEQSDEGNTAEELAWSEALLSPINMFKAYMDYIEGRSVFDTHQGIKGREFERVMVVLNDNESGGKLFSYDKLFGIKSLTETDKNNKKAGKDYSVDRTRRLFYVTCSRAMSSLAIVYYVEDQLGVYDHVISNQWFEREEVIKL